jgi:hypothetical protein
LLALWAAGSATHVYCLSYVYNFDLEYVFILPVLWVAVWTAYLRHGDFITNPARLLANVLLMPPLAVALLALPRADHTAFFVITLLNLAAYLALFLKDRSNRTAFHLLLLSGATLFAGLVKPIESAPSVGINLDSSGKWLLICAVAYGLYWLIRSRNPKAGVWGAVIVAIAMFNLAPEGRLGFELGGQCAMLFLLLHSLCWVDAEHRGAGAARVLAGVIWFLHSLIIVLGQLPHAAYLVYGAGGLLLAAAILIKIFYGNWRPVVAPIAALLVLLITPGEYAAVKLQATPAGYLAITGSFLLFGLGTIAALTKPRWNRTPAIAPVTIETETPR